MLYLYHVNVLTYYELVDQVTVGRTTGDIICADDGRMSGKHAQVTVEKVESQEFAYIQDLGSKNKTSVNRTEIPPNQKFKIKMYCLLEVGDQKFVLTDTKNVNMQNMNEMLDRQLNKPLIKFEAEEVPTPLPVEVREPTPFELLQMKEAKILSLHKDITAMELSAKSELIKLDEAREKLIANAKTKIGEVSKQMALLKSEVETAKIAMAKIKFDMELKKKKIINLKDLPPDTDEEASSDSTEELPE